MALHCSASWVTIREATQGDLTGPPNSQELVLSGFTAQSKLGPEVKCK